MALISFLGFELLELGFGILALKQSKTSRNTSVEIDMHVSLGFIALIWLKIVILSSNELYDFLYDIGF